MLSLAFSINEYEHSRSVCCFLLLVSESGAGTLLRVDLLDVVPLQEGALVRPEPSLGELVDALVGRTSPGLDHVEDPALVRGQSHHLPNQTPDHLDPGRSLLQKSEIRDRVKQSKKSCVIMVPAG